MKNDVPAFMAEFDDAGGDFGFTTVDRPNEEKVHEAKVETEIIRQDTNAKLKQLENLILPFLVRLYKSKEDFIHWPNPGRADMLKEKIEEILKITRGGK